MDEYFLEKKSEFMANFKQFNSIMGELIGEKYGEKFANTVLKEISNEYESIYEKIPYIGGDSNLLTFDLESAAENLAAYLVLKREGKPLSEIGEISYKACEKIYNLHPEIAPKSSPEYIPYIKKAAEESLKRKYPDDWVYTFIEGDGESDYGLDFTECGIVKLFNKYNADEFVPYLCAMDIIMSDASNAGIHRSETLAEGGKKCDFRYKTDRETRIKSTVRDSIH
jgi:hypothetical protein